jgi:ABC-type bacteriocin/lantibiotic exporter with double-glycine peptidase domain
MPSKQSPPPSKPRAAIALDIGGFKQSKARCGPACLKIVLGYFGKRVSEKAIARLCRTSVRTGTTGSNLVRGAKRLGLVATVVDRASFSTIEKWLARGVPVIVDWMSVLHWQGGRSPMACGHYSVVYAIDKTHVHLQDPAIGRERRIARKDFLNVWFDFKHLFPRKHEDLIIRRLIIAAPPDYFSSPR